MCEIGITAIYPKINLSKRNFKEAVVPYLLRNYKVNFPNQIWSIDITYIPMRHGHMYLTAIIDWYSRKIVGYHLSDTLDTREVLYTVREAVASRGIPSILNSDQGSQFTSDDYKKGDVMKCESILSTAPFYCVILYFIPLQPKKGAMPLPP